MTAKQKETTAQGVTLLLASLALQFFGAFAAGAISMSGGRALFWLVSLSFYAVTAAAVWRMCCMPSLAAALIGIILSCLMPAALLGQQVVTVLQNLLILALYLPVQYTLDTRCAVSGAPERLHQLGRRWVWTMTAGRLCSLSLSLPLFAGAEQASLSLGMATPAFQAQLALEMVALVALIISYVYQIRFLWRIKGLLAE